MVRCGSDPRSDQRDRELANPADLPIGGRRHSSQRWLPTAGEGTSGRERRPRTSQQDCSHLTVLVSCRLVEVTILGGGGEGRVAGCLRGGFGLSGRGSKPH